MNRIFRVLSSFVIGGFFLPCSLNLRSNYPPFCPGAVSQRNWFVTKKGSFIFGFNVETCRDLQEGTDLNVLVLKILSIERDLAECCVILQVFNKE
jgi:hypothetical protein